MKVRKIIKESIIAHLTCCVPIFFWSCLWILDLCTVHMGDDVAVENMSRRNWTSLDLIDCNSPLLKIWLSINILWFDPAQSAPTFSVMLTPNGIPPLGHRICRSITSFSSVLSITRSGKNWYDSSRCTRMLNFWCSLSEPPRTMAKNSSAVFISCKMGAVLFLNKLN